MNKFEIHSGLGNYYLKASVCNVDASDIGPNSCPGEFSGVELVDIVVSELQSKGWPTPDNYQTRATDYLDLSQAKIEESDTNGCLYVYDLPEKEQIQMYHSIQPSSLGSDTTYYGLGGTDLEGHVLTGWAEHCGNIIYFCDGVFNNGEDLRVMLNALIDGTKIHCTKDACVGYALKDQGSVSIRYKLPWKENTKQRLKTVKF